MRAAPSVACHLGSSSRLTLSLVLSLLALSGRPAGAQEVVPAPAPSIDVIEERLAEIRARADLDPSLAADVVERLERALSELQQAAVWNERKAEFDRLTAEAPSLFERIRAELTQSPLEQRPVVPEGATLRQIEALQGQAQAELAQARQSSEDLRQEAVSRSGRRTSIPSEVQEARARLAALLDARDAATGAGEEGSLAEARAALLQAQIENLESEVAARESELASYEARAELLPARRDRAQRRETQAARLVDAWRGVVAEARQREATAAAVAAAGKRRELSAAHPELYEQAGLAEQLALERSGESGLSARLGAVTEELSERRHALERLRERYQRVMARLRASARSTAVGVLLRNEYGSLPRTEQLERRSRSWAAESASAQYRLIELEEQRQLAGDPELRVQETLNGTPLGEAERAEFEAFARELYTAEREYLDALIGEYELYFERLVELIDVSRALVEETRSYRTEIEEHILWVRSVPGDRLLSLFEAGGALAWLLDPLGWAAGLARVFAEARGSWNKIAGLIALLLLALFAQRVAQRDLAATAPLVARFKTDRFGLTLRALVATFAAALPLPLGLWSLGRVLDLGGAPDVASAVGAGLMGAAEFLLPLNFLRKSLRTKGLAEAHFRWPAMAILELRRNLRWIIPVAVIVVALVVTLAHQPNERWSDSLGRLGFMVGMFPFALFLQRTLRPSGPVLATYLESNPDGLLARSRYILLALGTAAPIALALLAGLGYYYSALQLQMRLDDTLVLVIGLIFFNAVADRWLFLARRRMAVEVALKRRRERPASSGAPESGPSESSPSDTGPSEWGSQAEFEERVDIPGINAQTKKLFRVVTGLALVLGFFWIWAHVLPALRALENVRVWPKMELVDARAEVNERRPLAGAASMAAAQAGDVTTPASGLQGLSTADMLRSAERPVAEEASTLTVDLADVFLALLLLGLTWIACQNLPALLEMSILQRLPLDAGARYAFKTIVRYGLTIVGITAAFGAIGIGWGKVQWLAAALTFGLAFGLQEIFANFVSGLIILFERPIRLDDIVTVGGVEGRVSRIRMRATTILDWDRRELLVPNKEFITGQLINWTLTDSTSRYVLPVGVAYGSDTRLACELMLKAARESRFALAEPQPSAVFRHFGDSALLLELRVFMASRDVFLALVDDLHRRIDESFRAAGIEIAFPQMDLHLRSLPSEGGWPAVPPGDPQAGPPQERNG